MSVLYVGNVLSMVADSSGSEKAEVSAGRYVEEAYTEGVKAVPNARRAEEMWSLETIQCRGRWYPTPFLSKYRITKR